MLNESRVVKYVKANLGFPFQQIEMDDDDIIDYIKEFTLREYSRYMPEVRRLGLDVGNSLFKVPNRENEFYITETEGREIISVKSLVVSKNSYFFFGHPPYGSGLAGYGDSPGMVTGLRDWALQVENSMMLRKFSWLNYTHEFIHPNIIRISPNPSDSGENYVTIEYERVQSEGFSGIPNEFQSLFMELALADIMILIGRIRKKYGDGTLRTPFGEIPLGSEVGDEGKEKKLALIEKLETNLIPNIVVDFY